MLTSDFLPTLSPGLLICFVLLCLLDPPPPLPKSRVLCPTVTATGISVMHIPPYGSSAEFFPDSLGPSGCSASFPRLDQGAPSSTTPASSPVTCSQPFRACMSGLKHTTRGLLFPGHTSLPLLLLFLLPGMCLHFQMFLVYLAESNLSLGPRSVITSPGSASDTTQPGVAACPVHPKNTPCFPPLLLWLSYNRII